jgi:hypothetical protein
MRTETLKECGDILFTLYKEIEEISKNSLTPAEVLAYRIILQKISSSLEKLHEVSK